MGKTSFIFVSFYTPNYAEAAAGLRKSLDYLGLPHDLQARGHQMDTPDPHARFLGNVRHKPHFIHEMQSKHHKKYDAVVWVDSDARVQLWPGLLEDIEEDLAVHYRDGLELLSGTMFWRTNFRTRRAVGIWEQAVKDNIFPWMMCPEQQILQELIGQSVLGISVYYLPTEYCKIFDLTEANDVARDVIPIIEHFQASRQTRVGAPVNLQEVKE